MKSKLKLLINKLDISRSHGGRFSLEPSEYETYYNLNTGEDKTCYNFYESISLLGTIIIHIRG